MNESVKRRRVSKKNKKSWRKNVDTKDVDSFLESYRLEERLGVPFAERSNDDLFVLDDAPNKSSEDAVATAEQILKTKRERRLALRNAVPRCLEALKSHTAVPDPISKRNRVKTPEERKNPITKRQEKERKLAGMYKLKERTALKNKQLAKATRLSRPKRGEFEADVWTTEKKALPEVDERWLTSDTVRHTLAVRGTRKRKIPSSLHKKPSILPSVDVPHPGTSYNPSYEDHQDLLRGIAQQELKLIKEEAHLNRVTSKMFNKVTVEERERNWLRESSEGLPLEKKEKKHSQIDSNDDEEDNNDCVTKNPPAKRAKKTLVQRRKQREQRKLAIEMREAKIEKKKVSDIYKLGILKKKIAKKSEKVESLRKIREKVKAKKALEPKTLSRTKFEALEPVFKLGEELTGNLRNAEPIGNLLKDRFKSLQERNIVAPSNRILKRSKPNVKRFVKADHKINWEESTTK